MSTSVDFLRWFDPTGAHNLVAIAPDTRAVCGVTIPPGEWPKAEAFIEKWNGKRNLYWSVNEPKPGSPDDKLKESDIATIRAVYADVDPKPWELVNDSEGMASGDVTDLWREFGALAGAAKAVVASGSSQQIQTAAKTLAETRKRLFGMLAEDADTDR